MKHAVLSQHCKCIPHLLLCMLSQILQAIFTVCILCAKIAAMWILSSKNAIIGCPHPLTKVTRAEPLKNANIWVQPKKNAITGCSHPKTAVNRAWTLQIAITRAQPAKNAIRGLCPIRVFNTLHLILNSYHRIFPPTLSSCSINLFSLTPKQKSMEPQPEPFLRGECQNLAKLSKANLPRPFVKLPSCTLMCQPQLNPRF